MTRINIGVIYGRILFAQVILDSSLQEMQSRRSLDKCLIWREKISAFHDEDLIRIFYDEGLISAFYDEDLISI